MTKAQEIIQYMESLRNEEQRRILMGFFKTGPGEYGYGDEFLGLKVPQTREVVKTVGKDFPLKEVPELLMSKWHEVRLCGLLILVVKFERLATRRLANDEIAIRGRDEILTLYLKYAEQANNWDLVDLSAPKILGAWLLLPSNLTPHSNLPPKEEGNVKRLVLDELAQSDNLWKQRMSIVCTWKTSQMGDPSWCLRYAEIHLHHPHDLMHKAVGWMLREMGKRCSMELLRDFLRQHAHEMPRTMLRYAIEKMSDDERKQWMNTPKDSFVSDYVVKTNPYAGIPVPAFLEMILHGDDEAMYYLLHQSLNFQLHEYYNAYRQHLFDDFEDVIEDFFLYLRESGNYPYHALRRIKNIDAFETWLLNTFRNYLNNRADEENRITLVSFSEHDCIATPHSQRENVTLQSSVEESNETHECLSDEQKLQVASQLIAYSLQVFYPRGRFIFLRSLLTMLNKQKALPNTEVAKALGMSDISYRVTLHHLKCNLAKFRQRLLQGETLRLDDEHQQMSQRIYDEFDQLYPTLLMYYNQTIDTLKCAEDIKRLRLQYYEATGMMAHEPEPSTSVVVTASGFWSKLSKLLINVVII